MIRAYRIDGSAEILQPAETPFNFGDDIIWIDLIRPDLDEEHMAERLLGVELPTREDLKDIEPSSRLYVEGDTVFMTASLVCHVEKGFPEIADVAFILTGNRLVTIRYSEPRAFALFSGSLLRMPGKYTTGAELMSRLLETIVDRTAEILELAVSRVDALSKDVFVDHQAAKRRPPRYLEGKLIDISSHHRLVSKTRDSLVTLSRLVTFLSSLPNIKKDRKQRISVRSWCAIFNRSRNTQPSYQTTSPSCWTPRSASSVSSRTPSSRYSRLRQWCSCRQPLWPRSMA